ncbi:hypothetical protein ACFW04_013105 [Cataglyphis niger]
MVKFTSSGSSSDTNEPICAQLLTQLNIAYIMLGLEHPVQDIRTVISHRLLGFNWMVPKPHKVRFMKWNWSLIRKTCDPQIEWWQRQYFLRNIPGIFSELDKRTLHYPEYYSEISNMTDVNKDLAKVNGTEWLRDKQDAANDRVREPSALPASGETIRDITNDILSFIPSPLKKARREIFSSSRLNHQQEGPISEAIKFWQLKGVNGFYLQGLEYYVDLHRPSYIGSLSYIQTIFTCHIKALKNATSISAKNSILSRINLLDVTLRLTNSTMDIKTQIEQITKNILFDKPTYPRVASTINVKNASVAASLLSMMLPGTSSIFYGNEIGIEDYECQDHKDLAHVHNLVPMYWKKKNSPGSNTVEEMARLRAETTSNYVKAVLREGQIKTNCDVRYVENEIIVIEQWYPRRNSYVLDLSFLYYSGHVVVGPTYRMNRDVYFKELIVPPGEAFVIKLDK